jgi:hypothetical protein
MSTWTIPRYLARDVAFKEHKHPRGEGGKFATAGGGQKGGGIVETDIHRNIRKYLDRQGSYTSSGRGADYRAAKELAKADPSRGDHERGGGSRSLRLLQRPSSPHETLSRPALINI